MDGSHYDSPTRSTTCWRYYLATIISTLRRILDSMRLHYLFLLLFSSTSVLAQESETHFLYFAKDSHRLSSRQTSELDAWLKTLPDTIKKLEVIGHADFLGTAEYNLKLSERRANSVLVHIETSESVRYQISLVSAVGEENSINNGSVEGIPTDRKVEVIATVYATKASYKLDENDASQVSTSTGLLETAEVGQSIVFSNLNFFPGRHYLIPEALPSLEKLAQTLKDNPSINIEIQGHICCQLDSTDGYDQNTHTYTLSVNRAQYIYDQLVLTGIGADRLSYRGFAGTKPLIFPESTDEDRQRNRRVEITVTKK